MHRFVLLIAAFMLSALPVAAQQDEIEGVIRDQIEAFRDDDFARAFDHASPGIRALFGTPDRFGRMVEQGYPMVHRPSDVDFLGLSDEAGGRKQRVMMRDAGGTVHILEYDMIEVDGTWRIDGVRLLDAARIGV